MKSEKILYVRKRASKCNIHLILPQELLKLIRKHKTNHDTGIQLTCKKVREFNNRRTPVTSIITNKLFDKLHGLAKNGLPLKNLCLISPV